MDKWFKSKWFVRLISLAFAILLYVFVNIEAANTENDKSIFFPSGTEKVETIDDVPVQIRIDSDKYVVSGVPEFVSVSLEGAHSVMTPVIRQKNFDVYVDLHGLGEGEHTVDIEYENVPKELSVYIEPKTIDIAIEERASKEFKVNVDLINTDQLPEGYELGNPEVKPGTVTITSSRSVIDQIAIVKVFVDVAGITDSINNREVKVNVYDGQGNSLRARVEPENVVVSVPVDNPSKMVPVSVSTTGSLPDGFSLISIDANVQEVEVFATNNILDGIDEIATKKINLSEITKSGTIETSLALPKGTNVPDAGQVEVTIEVEQTRTIEDIPVSVENADSEQHIKFLKPDSEIMNVTVIGNEKDVHGLKPEDIQLSIDVKGLDSGEHRVPVIIKGPEEISIEIEYEEVLIEI